jgi:hypothetical protein
MICDIGDLRPGTPARISAANARVAHGRPTDLAGPCFLRYSLADGTRSWEHVGDDPDETIAARERKQAHFEALDVNRRSSSRPFASASKRLPQLGFRRQF